MKKLYGWLVGLLFLLILSSCNHGAKDNKPQEKGDPELVLKSLKIFKEDVDIEKMEYTSYEDVIKSINITARFDYGEEKNEAIGVVIEGRKFEVDKTQVKDMKLSVPAVKGEHQGWSGIVKVSIGVSDMEVAIGYDGEVQEGGEPVLLEKETVEFIVQSKGDIVDKVIINDGTQDHELTLEKIAGDGENSLWVARLLVLLNTDDFVTYAIKVMPKAPERYRQTNQTYILKGTKIADDNAEFVYINDGYEDSPLVVCDITWAKDCDSRFYEDYGAKSLKMTANTVSPRASVFVKAVNPIDDSPIATSPEIKLANNLGTHTGEVTLFSDKPTKLIAYVKAGDGATTNDAKGKWQLVFNSVDLFWGYNDSKLSTEELRKTAKKAYAEIEVEKAKATAGKVYVAFSIWDESVGFNLADSVKAMPDFMQLDTVGTEETGKHTAYEFSVDVSSLNVGDSKDVEIPIVRLNTPGGEVASPPIDAFTYKFKVKVR